MRSQDGLFDRDFARILNPMIVRLVVLLTALATVATLHTKSRFNRDVSLKATGSDIGSSLITLLNLSQEVGTSSNIKFRQSADRFREQFTKTFSTRYDVAKEYLNNILTPLSIIDSPDTLTKEAIALRSTIMKQLKGIEKAANVVVFYNEPIENLNEMKTSIYFPYEFFAPVKLNDGSETEDVDEESESSNNKQGIRDWIVGKVFNRKNKDEDDKEGNDSINDKIFRNNEAGVKDINRSRVAKSIADKVAADERYRKKSIPGTPSSMINTPSKAYGIKILNRIKSIRDKNVSSFMDPALAELNKIKIGLNAETRKWRSETLVDGTDDTTNPLIQRKGVGRTENIKWRLALEGIDSAKTIRSSSLKYARLPVTMLTDRTSKATQPNYAMLIHSCLMLSMATYNLKLNGENIVMNLAYSLSPTINMINSVLQESDLKPLPTPEEVVKEAERNEEMNKHRAFILANTAMGIAGLSPDNIQTKIIASDKACCLITYEKRRNTVTVSFRGTADPIDVVTDISFFTSRFRSRKDVDDDDDEDDIFVIAKRQEVHSGFYNAFDSIKEELEKFINKLPTPTNIIMTGHSMGGALAQLAAAYFSDLKPWLVTIGAPAVGNINFCRHLDDYAQPFGGIRVWNEYDIVPYIALLVGYSHAGVPIKMAVPSGAKEMFQKESQDSLAASALDAVSPHILYQVGTLLHVLPVMGFNSVAGAKIREVSTSTEPEVSTSTEPEVSVSTEAVVSVTTEAVVSVSTEAVVSVPTEAVVSSRDEPLESVSTEPVVSVSTEPVVSALDSSENISVVAASSDGVSDAGAVYTEQADDSAYSIGE